jgi:circadian clock protein KaiC
MDGQRIPTGIAGLDILLYGGYLKGRTYLFTGGTGTGKTVACLQLLSRALSSGEKAVYVTVDERPSEILDTAASFGWDFQPHIQAKTLVILDASPYFGGRGAGSGEKGIDPQKIVADLGNYSRRLDATLLFIDPITPLILPTDIMSPALNPARSLMQLIQSQLGTTNFFTAHTPNDALQAGTGAIEQFLASGVLVLATAKIDGKIERIMTIKKMRATAVEPLDIPFMLAPDQGIVLIDRPGGAGSLPQPSAPPTFEYFELPKKQL